jgi:peptidoglycan/xylan/chitin deacetylase (PgdA/CDA1 family)
LHPQDILDFHEHDDAVLPSRSFVITFDDGVVDCVAPLSRHGDNGFQLFVPTQALGGIAHWLDGEPLMTWQDVRSLAAQGVSVGAHSRNHPKLTEIAAEALRDELEGARRDLREHLDSSLELVAYPYGAHDHDVLREARIAGFRGGYTTEKGRNGAGTDRYCLRRVSIHAADGALAVLWKVLTGEDLPLAWRALQARVAAVRSRVGLR